MKNFSNFALLLAMVSVISTQVASWGGVMGREFMASPNIEHWLRALVVPDDCAGATGGEKVTDPDDCTKFFICIGPDLMSPDSYPCSDFGPTYECFDPISKDCSDNSGTECDTACTPTPSACLTACSAANDQIADMTDCERHYLCLGAGPDADVVDIYCPADKPYFDGAKCGTDKSACCNCQPETCVAAGDLIADPKDCHSFYTCTIFGGGDPVPVGPIPCVGGGSFDNGACDPATTECDNACDLGGGGDTTISAQSTATSDISTSASSLSTSPSELSSSASALSTSSTPATLTSTTSTSTPTTTPGCLDISDFTCPSHGFYARCPFCDPSYFSCDGAGGSPTQGACSGSLVFNPNPEYPFCVLPENCPI